MTGTKVEAGTRQRMLQLGLWAFIASEAMLFIGLLVVRFVLQGTYVPEHANQYIAFAITSVLLVSSVSAYRAEAAMANGDRTLFLKNVTTTIALGLVFLLGVGVEWYEAFEFFPPSTVFGSVFFVMTGMHAFHVITGLVFLAIVRAAARRGAYGPEDHWPVEAAAKYWHFVDVVWVFFYPALYLVS